jgi:hypothetical protein
MFKIESIKTNKSNTCKWVFALTVLFSVFSFYAFATNASGHPQKRIQTEERISVRKSNVKTAYYKLPSVVATYLFCVCADSFASAHYSKILNTKTENFCITLNSFFTRETIPCISNLPRSSSDLITISLRG